MLCLCGVMEKLIIKLYSNLDNDIRKVFDPGKVLDLPKKVLYVDNAEQLNSILSSKRLSLLIDLKKPVSVSSISKKTGRKQEAISRDATILEQAGLITKTKKGRQTFLKTRVKKIEIDLS